MLSYIKKQGGMFSTTPNQEAQLLLWWAESSELTLVPQFIMWTKNVVTDSFSRRHQVKGSEWTLVQEFVDTLQAMWPVTVYFFATFLNYRLPMYSLPLKGLMAAGMYAFLQVYEFPPFALI